MTFNLELNKVIEIIRKEKANKVLIQLPSGLKHKSKEIVDKIKDGVECEVFIWAGSCFGACDLPLEVRRLGFDLLIQWGHTEFMN